ncbi:DUF7344 domain-containing protein [Halosolutus halophilus]|uniref:DUF7344 domain-containing protein n=1 Tax=Halosolutus halophilus TaxID=1552990 RepID=UPI0022350D53|nr:ArsR family transcriptional regulator [Halosolutus halophilus]
MVECPIIDEDGNISCECDTDTVLRLLADNRRRTIVSVLDAHDDTEIEVERLAATLSTVTEVKETDRWKTELHHVHLPSLEDGKLIDYDQQSETVRYYQCELASTVLDASEPDEIG